MSVSIKKTVLKSEGLQFNYYPDHKNPKIFRLIGQSKTKVVRLATIDRKKQTVVYDWENINCLKLGTIDNLLHRIDCILKNQKPNP